jgi:aryl-alcohol dehydrogenase-like predicted oxidoreductase
VVSKIAAKHGASPHAVVLAWVLARADNVIVIPGARTADHALDSITAAELRLTAEDHQAIETAEFSID